MSDVEELVKVGEFGKRRHVGREFGPVEGDAAFVEKALFVLALGSGADEVDWHGLFKEFRSFAGNLLIETKVGDIDA